VRLELKLVDDRGVTHGTVSRNLSEEVAFMGDRAAEEFRLGVPLLYSNDPMAEAVKVLKAKEFRKDLLVRACADIGAQLSDFLQDREGWHGVERQEGCERMINKMRGS